MADRFRKMADSLGHLDGEHRIGVPELTGAPDASRDAYTYRVPVRSADAERAVSVVVSDHAYKAMEGRGLDVARTVQSFVAGQLARVFLNPADEPTTLTLGIAELNTQEGEG